MLLASDGLSDPFGDPQQPRTNGYGVEFYAITTDADLANYDVVTDLGNTWLYTLVGGLSSIEASGKHVAGALARYGLLSTELSGDAVPDEYRDKFCSDSGGVGALINLTHESVPAVLDGPLSEIRLVNVKLLTRKELDHVAAGGTEARHELAERFAAQGDPLVSSLDRESVI